MADVNDTLKERGGRYGFFEDNSKVTRQLMIAIEKAPSFGMLTDAQVEALHMITHKISRIVCGDPDYADSWVDIAGYATLVVNELEGTPQ